MITIGVDFSKRSSVYSVWDAEGSRVKRLKIENNPILMEEFFKTLGDEPKELTMEATGNWGLYYETIKAHVNHFYLGHPLKMKAITQSETKNDMNDADMIAKLTRSGFLPKAHISSLGTRQLRSLLRFRLFLVRQRTAIRNQIQILLDRNIWPCQRPASFKNPLCQRGLRWLKDLGLPDRERFILDQALLGFSHLNRQLRDIEGHIQTQSVNLPGMEYLRTVPGFHKSKVHIYTVLLEIDDITRFNKARNLAHYAGLIPREHSSGGKHRTGHLVRQANSHLRGAILESVFGAITKDKALGAYYQSVKLRKGSGTAIVATARKLSYAIYHVLKDKTCYKVLPSVTASGPLTAEE
jgi:transposase